MCVLNVKSERQSEMNTVTCWMAQTFAELFKHDTVFLVGTTQKADLRLMEQGGYSPAQAAAELLRQNPRMNDAR
jgi:hypothetical protein